MRSGGTLTLLAVPGVPTFSTNAEPRPKQPSGRLDADYVLIDHWVSAL
jgi:hypothetical protein